MADLFFYWLRSRHHLKHHQYLLSDLECQCYFNNSILTRLPFGGGLEHLKEPNSSFKNLLRKTFSRLPILDQENQWQSDIKALNYVERKFQKIIHHGNLGRYQLESLRLSQLNSHELLEDLIKRGFASHLVKVRNQSDQTYQVDLLHLYQYNVRSKLHRYGCLIILDQNLKITSIKVPHLTDEMLKHHANQLLFEHPNFSTFSNMKKHYQDLIWQQTCNLALSSIFLEVTLKNKVLDTHFHFLGSILVPYYKYHHHFPKEVKQLFQPFIFRGNLVNSELESEIISPRGLLVRIFGLSPHEFKRFFQNRSLDLKIPSPDLVNPIVPIKEDLIKFWDIYHDFSHRISKYLDSKGLLNEGVELLVREIMTKTNLGDKTEPLWKNLALIICHLIYTVSVWQGTVCSIAPYLLHPKLVQTRIFKRLPQSKMMTRSGFIQNVYLAFFNTLESMPKITENLWEIQSEDPYIQGIWKKLQKDLLKLEIKEKNLNSNLLECALTF